MSNQKNRFATSKQHSKKEDASAALLLDLIKSMAVTLLIGLLSLLICSLLAYFTEDPNAFIQPLGILSAAITAFGGGFAAMRFHRQSALLCGLLNGCALMAVMLLLSLAFASQASHYSMPISLLLHLSLPILSVFGAFLGVPRAKKPKKRKKH